MSSEAKQVIAVGQLGWTLRRIRSIRRCLPAWVVLQTQRLAPKEESRIIRRFSGSERDQRLHDPAFLIRQRWRSFRSILSGILPNRQQFYEELRRQYHPKSVQLSITYRPGAFAQMLAKAAFGFAVAHFGLDGIKQAYILNAIETGSDVGMWVGRDNDGKQLSIASDDIEVRPGFLNTPTRDIYAEIKVFGQLESQPMLLSLANQIRNS
jgi:hypothetical protein